MLKDEDRKFEQFEAGRVIDLKRVPAEETVEIKPRPVGRLVGFLFIFSFFFARKARPRARIDFLRNYILKEKEEEFVEREILKEFLDDHEEEKKKNILLGFFNFISRAARLWWLPLFIIRFIWIFFWKVFKLVFWRKLKVRPAAKPVIAAVEKEKPAKVAVFGKKEAKAVAAETGLEKDNLLVFWQAILALPRSVLNLLSGRTPEDYFYQRVLLEEVTKKKFNPFRQAIFFAVVLAVLILPVKAMSFYRLINIDELKGRVLGVSEQAVGDLYGAAGSISDLDLAAASRNFDSAEKNFGEAKANLEKINGLLLELGKYSPSDQLRLASYGREIFSAGEAASSLGENLALAGNAFFGQGDKKLSSRLDEFLNYEYLALADARKLNSILDKIDSSVLPGDYREEFVSLKAATAELETMLSETAGMIKKINVFLGAEKDKRYLFVFENNSEMRASGGFVGSFALVDFSQGKIKNIETPAGGSYDTDGGLMKAVAAPEPLWLVNPRWHFWDANWWPDWEQSAKKLIWFYEKSGGPTVDGCIAFTPTVLERILEVIGPIDMTEKYGVVMTSDNLWENLRGIIEKEKLEDQSVPYEIAEKKPKKIIGELFGRVMEELPKRLDREKLAKLLAGLDEDLSEKQILFYFTDEELQAEVEKRNWAGEIRDTNKDYLAVIDTNIAGGKSDGKIEEKIEHRAKIEEDGTIIDTLTIKRIHNGVKDELYYGVRNVNWLRVYVPEGSELISASGFRGPDAIYFETPEESWERDADLSNEETNAEIDKENLNTKIYNENGKTVFANWMMTDPGETGVIKLKYRLPFKFEKKVLTEEHKDGWEALLDKLIRVEKKDLYVYSLMAQKQAGSRFSSLSTSLDLPENFNVVWKYPSSLTVNEGDWFAEGKFDQDKYWAVMAEKNTPED